MRPTLKLLITFSLSVLFSKLIFCQELKNPNPFTFNSPGYDRINVNPLTSNGIPFYKGLYGSAILIDGFALHIPQMGSSYFKYSAFNNTMLSWDINSINITDRLYDGSFVPICFNNQINFSTYDIHTNKDYSKVEFNTFTGVVSLPKTSGRHSINHLSIEKGYGKFGYRIALNGGYDSENDFPYGAVRVGANVKLKYSPTNKLDIQLLSDFTNFNNRNNRKEGFKNFITNQSFSYLKIDYRPIEDLDILVKGSYYNKYEVIPFITYNPKFIEENGKLTYLYHEYKELYLSDSTSSNIFYMGFNANYSKKVLNQRIRISAGVDKYFNNSYYQPLFSGYFIGKMENSYHKFHFSLSFSNKNFNWGYNGNLTKYKKYFYNKCDLYEYNAYLNHEQSFGEGDQIVINNYKLGLSVGKTFRKDVLNFNHLLPYVYADATISILAYKHLNITFTASKNFDNTRIDEKNVMAKYVNQLNHSVMFSLKYDNIKINNFHSSLGTWFDYSQIDHHFAVHGSPNITYYYKGRMNRCSFGINLSAELKNTNLDLVFSGYNGGKYPYFKYEPIVYTPPTEYMHLIPNNYFKLSKLLISQKFNLKKSSIDSFSIGFSYDLSQNFLYNNMGTITDFDFVLTKELSLQDSFSHMFSLMAKINF